MKHRGMKGIPKVTVAFAAGDDSPFAPLHRRMGIRTKVHRQAILCDPRFHQWDPVSRTYSHQHLFRDNITLAAV